MPSNPDKVYIIGYGAVGRALAVFLRLAGRNPVLIRGSVDGLPGRIERLRVDTPGGVTHEADIVITTLSEYDSLDGMVVLATKSYGNERLSELLLTKIGASPLVLLQNGLGVERPFLRQGFPEVYRAVLFATSQPVDTTTVRFRPVSDSPVGIEKGSEEHLDKIVRQLHTPDFTFKSEASIQSVIWQKAIINCVFNSVCPLLEADNGLFHRNGQAWQLARRVIAECTAVALALGVPVREEEIGESLLRISRLSDGQLISTLLDIRHHRRTELDALNFEIVRIAESLGLGDRVRETRLLGELAAIKAGQGLEIFN
jgi:2-dehydropantoate 2-reductase